METLLGAYFYDYPELVHLFFFLVGGAWAIRTRHKVYRSNTLTVLGNLSVLICVLVFFVFQQRTGQASQTGNVFDWLLVFSVMLLGIPIFVIWGAHLLAGRQVVRAIMFVDELF